MTKIYIETAGCSLNQNDSEVMAGLLKKADFEIGNTPEESDLVILNTCTVKGPTEAKFWKRLCELKNMNKKIIISGCIAQTVPEELKDFSLIGTAQINNIVEVVEETLNDSIVKLLIMEKNPRLNLPIIRKNPMIEIIPICSGCLGEPCSYCKVKQARGNLVSYEKDAIIKQIQKARLQAAKEIWLTAQDTGCYGKDIKLSLPKLLQDIISLPGNFKIRIGMMNPNHIIEFIEELINILKDDKVFKFLHIPVQSGNSEILKLMKRKYSVEDFREIVKKLRKAIPNIAISTDIICGFPTETEEQFLDSLDLIKEITPDVLNISRFWPRPGTEAEKMENQIHGNETKRRSQLLTDIFNNISLMNNEKWIGWEGEILVDEKGKDNTWIGRNYAYKPVIVKGDLSLGETVKVKIEKAAVHDLRGIVL